MNVDNPSDIIARDPILSTYSVYFNTSRMTSLQILTLYDVQFSNTTAIVTNENGDEKSDIIDVIFDHKVLSSHLNIGNDIYSIVSPWSSLFLIDIYGDSYPDIIITNLHQNNIRIFYKKNNIIFIHTNLKYLLDHQLHSIRRVDMNDDGQNDIIVTNYESNMLCVSLFDK